MHDDTRRVPLHSSITEGEDWRASTVSRSPVSRVTGQSERGSGTLINGNSEKANKSHPFFAERGHSQIRSGDYDAPPQNTVPWLKTAEGMKGIDGAMYTTWQADFTQLEKFAELAWGG